MRRIVSLVSIVILILNIYIYLQSTNLIFGIMRPTSLGHIGVVTSYLVLISNLIKYIFSSIKSNPAKNNKTEIERKRLCNKSFFFDFIIFLTIFLFYSH